MQRVAMEVALRDERMQQPVQRKNSPRVKGWAAGVYLVRTPIGRMLSGFRIQEPRALNKSAVGILEPIYHVVRTD